MNKLIAALSLALLPFGSLSVAEDNIPTTVTATVENTTALVPAAQSPSQTTEQPPVAMMSVGSPALLTARDYLAIKTQPVEGKGKYTGIEYTLQNKKPNHLQILHAEVLNGVDEVVAATEELQSKNKKRRMGGFLLRGVSALPGIGALGTGSYAAARVAATTANVGYHAAAAMDASAQNTVADIEGQYVKQFQGQVISPNETFHFRSLLPSGVKPQLKLVFKNLETNQILDWVE